MVGFVVVAGAAGMWGRYASEQAERRKREALFRSLSTYSSRPASAEAAAEVKPAEPADPRDTFDAGLLQESFEQVKERVGPEFKLMEVSVGELGFGAHVSTDGQSVQAYRRPKGKRELEGPGKVEVIGEGDLKNSLFDPSAVNLSLIPKLLEDAKERAGIPDGRATSVRFNYPLFRYKGESPEWTVFVESGEGDNWQHKFVTFDAKGKFKRVS